MADLINTVLVTDDRIAQITDTLKYGVYSGASQISEQIYQAQTSSSSQSVWTIQVPSQNILIDKRVKFRSTQTIKIPYTMNAGPYQPVGGTVFPFVTTNQVLASVGYGKNCSLSAFPLHHMMNVLSATLNSTSVNCNIQDVLPFMLKMIDRRELRAYNSYAPTAVDSYGNYDDQVGANNSSFASYGDSADPDIIGNGAWKIDKAQFTTLAGVVLDATSTIAAGVQVWLNITFTSTEPLMLSPFTFANVPFSKGALYGLTALTFNITKLTNANRVWRASPAGNTDFTPDITRDALVLESSPTNPMIEALLITYMNAGPTHMLPATNVSNYYELPKFINQLGTASINSLQTSAELQSQSLQLNFVPDMVMLGVIKKNKKFTEPDAFIPIKRISMNFNAVVGILSSTQPQTLYQMTKDNGYSGGYLEWDGNAFSNSGTTEKSVVQTSGGFLALKFAKDINIPESYLAPGSIGNFILQFSYQIYNNTNAVLNAEDYQLMIIPMNSGVCVTNSGSTVLYTAMLSKEKVLATKESGNNYTEGDVQRLVGGSFWGSLKNIASSLAPIASIAKPILGSISDPRAQAASQVLGALGAGTSGGRRRINDQRL